MRRCLTLSDDAKAQWSLAWDQTKGAVSMIVGDNIAIKLLVLNPLYLYKLNSDENHIAGYGMPVLVANALLPFVIVYYNNVNTLFPQFLEYDQADAQTQLQKRTAIAKALRNGVLYAIPASLAVGLPMYFSGWMLENIFRQSSDVAEIAQSFLRPFSASAP